MFPKLAEELEPVETVSDSRLSLMKRSAMLCGYLLFRLLSPPVLDG